MRKLRERPEFTVGGHGRWSFTEIDFAFKFVNSHNRTNMVHTALRLPSSVIVTGYAFYTDVQCSFEVEPGAISVLLFFDQKIWVKRALVSVPVLLIQIYCTPIESPNSLDNKL